MIPFVLTVCLVILETLPAISAELGERRLYECVATSRPPKIDGQLDDDCWKDAPVSGAFTRTLQDQDKPPSVQTYLRLLYDDDHLYIGVKCEEPHPERLQVNILDDDNVSVCGDDSIEMFFQPNLEAPDYYQLVSNSRGVRYDGRILDGSWNAVWTARTFVAADAWYLECSIDLSSFPERRSMWGFNVCRELRSTDPIEFHCWSNTYGGFHNPDRFGHLIFSGPFANLRRGHLIQAADYAKTTLTMQQQLMDQSRAIREMRLKAPENFLTPFESQLRMVELAESQLIEKYGKAKELSLAEWETFKNELDKLLKTQEHAFWALRYHLLLND